MTTQPPAPAAPEQPLVLARTDGRVGRLTLNRPRAINALNHPMVTALHEQLTAWAADPAVAAVVVTGAGERGLCAGGDIRFFHDDAKVGGAGARAFFGAEYRLNHLVSSYPKPYVAVMDGLVLGGGVGISAHGSVRVVTERSAVGMPETTIGFVPDVGGSWLLAHAPGELGTHLALTAGQLTGPDALHCGLADHFVPGARLPGFTAALADLEPADAVARFAEDAGPAPLAEQRDWIDACYAADTVEEIVARLLAAGLPEAKEAAELIGAKSPTALKVTLAALRRARELPSLAAALNQEYRVSLAGLSSPDFVEGIRAQVVDKDRNPRWSPATLAEVSAAEVARHFAPLGAGRELGLPTGPA
ncbi:enoyl-CoA hydratase/isomerase family protein [Kitasatospora sp. NBC_01287]|uniref:enoyl-CoA hydratase/isomerase family protein n=1 Tax=Kitasatospora sp. NBC_01287 TaxID=2903573 RepID=UPI002253E874|nr:enoyl-CoA hydratase/isomerase family protein [Kitasatospora sp. NBC_01287]MCX4747470.1 enoyl-CoA hydratase/isomerase family protein [Kitasatospora sp. NBC_01287]